jgi:hypothetical protein
LDTVFRCGARTLCGSRINHLEVDLQQICRRHKAADAI